jgi:hypothetical protein
VINELPLTTQTLAATVCKTMTGKPSNLLSSVPDPDPFLGLLFMDP